MATAPRSLLANVSSITALRFWQAGLHLVITPIYLALLGPEAYGLLAFHATLILTIMSLDQLATPTLIREVGRVGLRPDTASDIRQLLHNLERLSFLMAAVIGLTLFALAPLLARDWFQASKLPVTDIENAIRLMALSLALQWPSFLYSGGFVALHRQDLLGIIRAVTTTCQALGGALVLWLVSPSIVLLLAWHAAFFFAQSVVCNRVLWRLLPPSTARLTFDLGKLRPMWVFGAGTFVISVTSALVSTSDKLIVSKLVSLAQFSAYSVSSFLILNIYSLAIMPVWVTLQPHFARLFYTGDEAALAREYHRWTQNLAVVVLAVLGPVIAHPRPVLAVWLGPSSPLLDEAAQYLPLFALGYVFFCFSSMATLLQVAAGWIRLSVIRNVVSLCLFWPAVYFGVKFYGPWAGAVCWLILNAGSYVVEVALMHRRLLRGELWTWWTFDTMLPMIVTGLILLISMAAIPIGLGNPWIEAAGAAVTGGIIVCTLAALMPYPRQEVRALHKRFFGKAGA